MALQKDCIEARLNMKFKFTAPGMPQQNGVVECMFVTLYSCTCSMLNGGNFTQKMRDKLWAECAKMATDLESIMATKSKVKTEEMDVQIADAVPYKKFYGKMPAWTCHLRTFGEMAIVMKHKDKKTHGKLEDRGYPCIMLGYPKDHARNMY